MDDGRKKGEIDFHQLPGDRFRRRFSLLDRFDGQKRRARDIANGINMVKGRLRLAVDLDKPVFIRFHAKPTKHCPLVLGEGADKT